MGPAPPLHSQNQAPPHSAWAPPLRPTLRIRLRRTLHGPRLSAPTLRRRPRPTLHGPRLSAPTLRGTPRPTLRGPHRSPPLSPGSGPAPSPPPWSPNPPPAPRGLPLFQSRPPGSREPLTQRSGASLPRSRPHPAFSGDLGAGAWGGGRCERASPALLLFPRTFLCSSSPDLERLLRLLFQVMFQGN